eukprot:1510546-Amphidinium_carterae.1
MACITKAQEDSTIKVRLIIDMRRSGVNKTVVTEERLVLPRLDDVAEDVKELLELGGDVNFAVVD